MLSADHPPPQKPRPTSWWPLIALAALVLALYARILFHLVVQWKDPNFSHGYFVPLFSAFVVWEQRHRLARLPLRPSWTGLPVLASALCVLVLGQLGAELFLSRFSLLLVLAGIIVLLLGWNYLRALAFPLAFLLLMIPLPAILLNQITFPLQLLASRIAAEVLPWFNVPVFREGNVIHLPNLVPMKVAEACSGIRSLEALTTLSIIYGYLMERSLLVRVFLAVASVPIAVAANSVRIIIAGLLVQSWGPEAAEGFLHAFSGWVIFVVSLALLYVFHLALCALLRRTGKDNANDKANKEEKPDALASAPTALSSPASADRNLTRLSLAASLLLVTTLLLHFRGDYEVSPPRTSMENFPKQLGDWTSSEIPIDQDTLNILGPGDYLDRTYDSAEKNADTSTVLFIAYVTTQRTGQSIHSPRNCLPGDGWSPLESSLIQLSFPGHVPFPANRYIVAKGDERQVVLYWYWAHDRGIASEYWSKIYLVLDSIRLHRSDGALVRLSTTLRPGETADQAQQRIAPLTTQILPLLNTYIPR